MPPDRTYSLRHSQWLLEEVQPHEAALRAWLRSRYADAGDADDIIHETYLNLLRHGTREPVVCSKAYLFTVARNVALRLIHKNRFIHTVPLEEISELPDLAIPANAPIGDEDRDDQFVVDAIASLPERCRAAVELRAIHGLEYGEIARRLGIAEATVRVQVARGIRKCAEFLRAREARRP